MIKSLIHSMVVCPDMNLNYPKILYGEGVYLYDEAGRKYMDASSGAAAVSNFGHGIKEIGDIINKQIQKVSILPTHAFSSDIVEKYLDKLIQFAPKGFKRAWTVMSGTEAVENAVKIALQYQQVIGESSRYKIISRWQSYHGNSIFTLDIGGMKFRRQMYGHWMHNFPHLLPVYYYRYGNHMTEAEYCDFCVQQFNDLVEKNDPETIAAYIAEPTVGAALGAVVPPKNYFSKIKERCEHYGILFISDEVMTGFGRLGANFGIERFNTLPDIIAAGKGISGGYFPLSAVLINDKISKVIESQNVVFKAGHTFACNPVGAAVGSFIIDFMYQNEINQNVLKVGALLKKRLMRLKELEIVGDIRGEGLLLGVEFVKDKISKTPFPSNEKLSKRIYERALAQGIVLYPGSGSVNGIDGDHMLISPPLTITEDESLMLADAIYDATLFVQTELYATIK